MRISIIGTGYVGLVSGTCFAELGHSCTCVDIDEAKVRAINDGHAPIHETGLPELLKRVVPTRLAATTDLQAAVRSTDVTFIAVGTPFDGVRIDLKYIKEAARQIGTALKGKAGYHVVVVKSTVVPGTTDDVVGPILEEASGKKAGRDFGLGMNPEFLTEGVAVRDFMEPDRIVIGGMDPRSIAVQREIYAGFARTPVVETNNKTAEMIKYASNSVLATLISFSNEIANTCSRLGGIDAADVMRGVHLARYFAATKEGDRNQTASITAFLWPGCGYGGSCLPKDTKALSSHSAAHGQPMPLLDAVIATNARQPQSMLDCLARHFPSPEGVRATVLGLAFKEDTDDVRESPAIPLIKALAASGASVTVYDPVVTSISEIPASVTWARSLAEAIQQAQVVLLVTRWAEFEQLPRLLSQHAAPPLLIDGRRVIAPSSVPRYDGIGLGAGSRT